MEPSGAVKGRNQAATRRMFSTRTEITIRSQGTDFAKAS